MLQRNPQTGSGLLRPARFRLQTARGQSRTPNSFVSGQVSPLLLNHFVQTYYFPLFLKILLIGLTYSMLNLGIFWHTKRDCRMAISFWVLEGFKFTMCSNIRFFPFYVVVVLEGFKFTLCSNINTKVVSAPVVLEGFKSTLCSNTLWFMLFVIIVLEGFRFTFKSQTADSTSFFLSPFWKDSNSHCFQLKSQQDSPDNVRRGMRPTWNTGSGYSFPPLPGSYPPGYS